MTSTPGGSARCSRTGRPSLVSKGAAASARAARGRLGVELALKPHETPDLRVRADRAGLRGRLVDGGRRCRVARRAAMPGAIGLVSSGQSQGPRIAACPGAEAIHAVSDRQPMPKEMPTCQARQCRT